MILGHPACSQKHSNQAIHYQKKKLEEKDSCIRKKPTKNAVSRFLQLLAAAT
jgi:hypothetical protein